MPDLLKNKFNYDSLYEMGRAIQSVYSLFQADEFIKSTIDETWEDLELKARVRKISTNLGKYLPTDYAEALAILDKVVEPCQSGFFGILFPDFVEVYGQNEADWNLSVNALERYTPYSTSEFAVRPFIIKNQERMMAQMYAWSKHENEHVRRLASEGCRPQLPWGQALTEFKKDPGPILPILEQLKSDKSLYVRKSVANNLNDISKTHPELVIRLAKDWYGNNEYTDWIVKHGCRTLLKQGNREALKIFGYNDADAIEVDDFTLDKTYIYCGEAVTFSFLITAKEASKVRLEYGIEYVKANEKRNRKIFQISEITMDENEKKRYSKKHSFADLTTRKHYPGLHSIVLIVNGVERCRRDFELRI